MDACAIHIELLNGRPGLVCSAASCCVGVGCSGEGDSGRCKDSAIDRPSAAPPEGAQKAPKNPKVLKI